MTGDVDPVSILTDGATVAQWNNEGLPGDKMSTQNATILINCEFGWSPIENRDQCWFCNKSRSEQCTVAGERWPLLIDPQLQGIKWIKNRYGNRLKVVSLGQKG